MKCLSIRYPAAWLIFHAGMDVENRPWTTRYRGPLLIHASPRLRRRDFEEEVWRVKRYCGVRHVPSYDELREQAGGIVGVVMLKRVTLDRTFSRWFRGPFGFVLDRPTTCELHRCKAYGGIFDSPIELETLTFKKRLAADYEQT